MAKDDGNTPVDGSGSNGEDTPQTVEELQESLKAERYERAESEKALRISLSKANEESKSRRLKIDELTKSIEASTISKAEGSSDLDVIRTELTGIISSKEQEINRLTSKLREGEVLRSINSVAQSLGAIYPEDVVSLIKPHIGYDDKGNSYIINKETSQPLLDGSGNKVSIADYTKSMLLERPNYIKGSGNKGSGSHKGDNSKIRDTFDVETIKGMSAAEYAKHRSAILKQAASGRNK